MVMHHLDDPITSPAEWDADQATPPEATELIELPQAPQERARTRVFRKGVGLVVIAAAAAAAGIVVIGLRLTEPTLDQPPEEGLLFGIWNVLYDTTAPSWRAIILATGVALLAAAAVAVLEQRIANRYRRSEDASGTPLAPKIVMAQTAGVYAGPVTVTAVIPAHNEAAGILATLQSLRDQDEPPERVVVVADNCTDDTAELARADGVEVFESQGNSDKKAGALNQFLSRLLPQLGDNDTVLVMDADTVLDQGYLRAARARMSSDRALMAVGGLFYGDEGGGLLGQFQRNEYTRYSRDIRRRRGRLFVLTGTASTFRARALKTVAQSRGSGLPGRHGDVYDTAALTEDNELTIALKSLGALMASPPECAVVTEIMPTWQTLWNQRLRWQRGALENLGAYGVTPQTLRYWSQQLGIGYGVVALASYVILFAIMAVALDSWIWFPFWLGLGALFTVERIVGVWAGGWRARVTGALLFPELFYATVLNVVYVKGVLDIAFGREARWRHLSGGDEEQVTTTGGAP